MSRLIKQRIRTVKSEEREFHLDYRLGENDENSCFILALLRARDQNGVTVESASSVTVHCRKLGQKVFDMISGANDPVFPVHLPDIVRDHLSTSGETGSVRSEEVDPRVQ